MSTVHGIFEKIAARAPLSIALTVPGGAGVAAREVTYAELDRRANDVARRLLEAGVERGDLVGLMMGRSVEMVASMIGILKAGAAYVPLDPSYPAERLEFMVGDAALSVVLTVPAHEGAACGVARVMVIEGGVTDGAALVSRAHDGGTADDAAYVIYTSGSTGQPKGVVVPHRGIARLVIDASYVRLDETRVTLQLAPISFDAATFEIWGALLNGGRCVLAPETGVPDLALLRRTIEETGVTTMWLTASLFNVIIDRAPQTLATVEEVLTGGEALSVVHVRRALDVLPRVSFINGYGPTESTTFTCCYRIPRPFPRELTSVPIGFPITRTTVHVLDTSARPVSHGTAGELHIGGDGLALGYLRRPALTAERFIEHPLAGGGRLYRTGDRVRELADGAIEFLGRLDDQVKLRGHRIEPGEVEAALRALPEVGDAVVALRDDAAGERQLVGYYTARDPQWTAADDTIRARLAASLPEYMVPSRYVRLEEIPVTANGKADRGSLPAPGARRRSLDQPAAAPRTPVEEWIAGLWREALALDQVGVNDRFFELGGTSLSAMRLLARLREATGAELPALLLFRAATVAELAALLEREHGDVLPMRTAPRGVAARVGGQAVADRAERKRDELRDRRIRRRNGS